MAHRGRGVAGNGSTGERTRAVGALDTVCLARSSPAQNRSALAGSPGVRHGSRAVVHTLLFEKWSGVYTKILWRTSFWAFFLLRPAACAAFLVLYPGNGRGAVPLDAGLRPSIPPRFVLGLAPHIPARLALLR